MPQRAYRSIPGPSEISFIGSVHRRFSGPLEFFRDLQSNFGDAARFTLFNERFIIFSHPALVNEVLVTKQNSFRKGKALEGARVFLGNSLLVSEGEEHKRQRRLIQPAFHRGRIAGYAQTMAEKARLWTDAQRPGAEIDLGAGALDEVTLAAVQAAIPPDILPAMRAGSMGRRPGRSSGKARRAAKIQYARSPQRRVARRIARRRQA